MFTGLVQHVGNLLSRSLQGSDAEISVSTSFENLEIGESIAIMGACLTVTKFETGRFTAFASSETLAKTGLLGIPTGSPLNLERALKVGDPIGGHIVTGHVDSRVKLKSRRRMGKAEQFSLALPEPPLDSHIAPKGSVALDGVSLTVNEVDAVGFNLMIIPLTLEHTTLGKTQPGDLLNIETDVLAKYVARQIFKDDTKHGDIDIDLLRKTGFMR